MRYALLGIVFCVMSACAVYSQAEQKIRVHAGEDLMKAISDYGAYRFESFTTGMLFYKYRKNSTAKFNYHLLTGEMRFIDPGGDTLAIANPDQVSYINISGSLFYYDHGYLEVIADYDSLQLAVQQKITVDYEKIGAYGQTNTSSAIDNNKTYSDRFNTYSLTINQDAVVRKNFRWFIVDETGKSTAATKSNILKLFDAHKTEINDFIKTNDLKFNKEEDLKKLLRFCTGLH
ncbi:MAG: hypothetical protein ABI921_07665 [Panacibacter sp.]